MLAPGTVLGPYAIVAPLGAGGMGEVYRARDARLGREVAVKVLSARLAATPEAHARFEREARTISQLSHPHICALYDVGREGDIDYLVMELLEGETLARRLARGPLPVADVLRLGAEIASALARAHAAGVVHRDLKPGNVMLTRVGAKLMDFGLARPAGVTPAAGTAAEQPTLTQPLTSEGSLLGTFQYMAPEQLEGRDADARSDIWALGCVLYEMATGQGAFEGRSQASLMASILKDVPRTMVELQPVTPPALERVVSRCLAKDPDDRFQNASDLAFDLGGIGAGGATTAAGAASGRLPARFGLARGAISFLLGVALVATTGYLYVRRHESAAMAGVSYERLTVRHGTILDARFAADGHAALYSAAWDGETPQIYESRPGTLSSRALGVLGADVLSVSDGGRIAIQLAPFTLLARTNGTLAEVPLAGGAPRQMLTDVLDAAWLPDGSTLAVIHQVAGRLRLESPIGRTLYEPAGMMNFLRVSGDGRHFAVCEGPRTGDTHGCVVILDASGHPVARGETWSDISGLAWSADDCEVWYSASQDLSTTEIRALSVDGRDRLVIRQAGRVLLHDIAGDGQVLWELRHEQRGIRGCRSGADNERELTWCDHPYARGLSADGSTLLFSEDGLYGGPRYAVCVRGTDGSPPVRLGEGAARALSPDGRWVLALCFGPPDRLLRLPTGPGVPDTLPRGDLANYGLGSWLPDGKAVVFTAREEARAARTYRQDLDGTLPRAITPEGVVGTKVSCDGRFLAAVSASPRKLCVYPIEGGEPAVTLDLAEREVPCGWSADGKSVYVSVFGSNLEICLVDLATGRRVPWKTFRASDPAGFTFREFLITPDGLGYAYDYTRVLSDLYLVDGLR